MANGKAVSNDRIYDAINSSRLELKGDITRLENKFDNLEAGRLTRLEERVGKGEVKAAIGTTKLAILITGITLVVSAAITIFLDRTIK